MFVVVDILLEQAGRENCMSVQRVCSDVRRQCPGAVPTLGHYVFVYDCLHELLCTGYAWLDAADLKTTYRLLSRPVTVDGPSYFDEQFDLLGRHTGPRLDQGPPHRPPAGPGASTPAPGWTRGRHTGPRLDQGPPHRPPARPGAATPAPG